MKTVVTVRVPRGTASVVLHTKVPDAIFHQRLPGRRALNFPANTPVALYTGCQEIEVACDGPSELEWFP